MARPRHAVALYSLSVVALAGLCLLWCLSIGAPAEDRGVVPCRAEGVPSAKAGRATEALGLVAVQGRAIRERRGQREKGPERTPSVAGRRSLRLAQWQIAGRVVDLDGQPLSGHSIRLGSDAPGEQRARSDAEGAFALRMAARADVLVAAAPGFVTGAATRARHDRHGLVVALPAAPYTVTVADAESGLPLATARVTTVPSEALRTRLEALRAEIVPAEGFARDVLPRSTTTRTGEVSFDALPAEEWVEVWVTRPGYVDQRVSFDGKDRGALAIWMEPLPSEVGWRGRVVDADGQPISGAWVARSRETVRAKHDGSFVFDGAVAEGEGLQLHAYHPRVGAVQVEFVQPPECSIEVCIPRSSEPLRMRLLSEAKPGDWQGVPSARVLPVGADGRGDVLGPFWLGGQSCAQGTVELPSAMEGASMVAYGKGGQELGRFTVGAGDVRILALGGR